MLRDAWMWHTQVMTARENKGSHEGLFLAAKAGHNGESHNHNDVGNFIVYADGNPVLIDLGTEEYTAKTFSPRRFELWYLQSQYHNCPTVRGVLQHDGLAYAARDVTYHADDLRAEMRADISGAYPAGSGPGVLAKDVPAEPGGIILRGDHRRVPFFLLPGRRGMEPGDAVHRAGGQPGHDRADARRGREGGSPLR